MATLAAVTRAQSSQRDPGVARPGRADVDEVDVLSAHHLFPFVAPTSKPVPGRVAGERSAVPAAEYGKLGPHPAAFQRSSAPPTQPVGTAHETLTDHRNSQRLTLTCHVGSLVAPLSEVQK